MRLNKRVALILLKAAGFNRMARHLMRRYFRILAYHGVDDHHDPIANFDGFQVSPGVFREQMDVLAKHYTVWPLTRIVRGVLDGAELPDNLVALTFDDGYHNNLRVAAPILKEYGFQATFFVTTGFIDGTHQAWWYRLRSAIAATRQTSVTRRGVPMHLGSCADRIRAILQWEHDLKNLRDHQRQEIMASLLVELEEESPVCLYPFMSWSDVRALVEDGFDVAPHTISHSNLGAEDGVVMAREICFSMKRIQEEIGCVAPAYAYPYGGLKAVNEKVRNILADEGISCAVTAVPGMNDRKSDLYLLKRFNITGNHGALSFDAVLAGLRLLHRARSAEGLVHG